MAEKKIGTIISQLLSRRGYASVTVDEELTACIAAVVGPTLAGSFRVGKINAGVLHLFAGDSVTTQELTFQKRQILKRLQQDQPQAKITDIRFRTG